MFFSVLEVFQNYRVSICHNSLCYVSLSVCHIIVGHILVCLLYHCLFAISLSVCYIIVCLLYHYLSYPCLFAISLSVCHIIVGHILVCLLYHCLFAISLSVCYIIVCLLYHCLSYPCLFAVSLSVCHIITDKKDRESLLQALDLSKDILQSVDEQIAVSEKQMRLQDIYQRLDGRSYTVHRGKKFRVSVLLVVNWRSTYVLSSFKMIFCLSHLLIVNTWIYTIVAQKA